MHELILKGTGLVYREEFSQAEKAFKEISKKWPDSPVGPFFEAAVTDAVMEHYGTDKHERRFFEHCDKAIRLGERAARRDPTDLWALFFVGGANGYKGTYEARYKRWISAFRNGFEGISVLQKVAKKDTTLVDAGMGIGTYLYWRSNLMKTLWWMPGVEDKREQGIAMLRKTMERGRYAKEGAAKSLMWVLITEGRHADALLVVERMLAIYPNCRSFLWGKAECHYQMGQWRRAEETIRYILDTVEADDEDNHFHAIRCRHYLANIHYRQKVYYRCLAECRRILQYSLDIKITNRLKDSLAEIRELLKKAGRKHNR